MAEGPLASGFPTEIPHIYPDRFPISAAKAGCSFSEWITSWRFLSGAPDTITGRPEGGGREKNSAGNLLRPGRRFGIYIIRTYKNKLYSAVENSLTQSS